MLPPSLLQLQKMGAHTNHFCPPGHAHQPIKSARYSTKFHTASTHFPPFPFPSPSPFCLASKLIHLRVVAGLQRDLVIASPSWPRPASHASYTSLSLLWFFPLFPPPNRIRVSAHPQLLRAANKVFECLPRLGLICKVMRRHRIATFRYASHRLSLVSPLYIQVSLPVPLSLFLPVYFAVSLCTQCPSVSCGVIRYMMPCCKLG